LVRDQVGRSRTCHCREEECDGNAERKEDAKDCEGESHNILIVGAFDSQDKMPLVRTKRASSRPISLLFFPSWEWPSGHGEAGVKRDWANMPAGSKHLYSSCEAKIGPSWHQSSERTHNTAVLQIRLGLLRKSDSCMNPV